MKKKAVIGVIIGCVVCMFIFAINEQVRDFA